MIRTISTPILNVQRPTREGVPEVQAEGSIVSSAVTKPMMIENPVTDAVIVPKVTAAKALVEMWPIDITGAIDNEYSRR
jgi:hypothetical protein